jgi:hypothetical protein
MCASKTEDDDPDLSGHWIENPNGWPGRTRIETSTSATTSTPTRNGCSIALGSRHDDGLPSVGRQAASDGVAFRHSHKGVRGLAAVC